MNEILYTVFLEKQPADKDLPRHFLKMGSDFLENCQLRSSLYQEQKFDIVLIPTLEFMSEPTSKHYQAVERLLWEHADGLILYARQGISTALGMI